jgi:hypothetical protein
MSVQVVERHATLWSFRCDGCGHAWRRRTRQGPPVGWRRMRAGDVLAELCASCLAIGVWRDHPEAAAIERHIALMRPLWEAQAG